ncbi:hypothetical protein BURK2_04140 [Burkholderiales bacterium]|nr:hypothetical protein BURK2_04140 [Burkholderiales bacterium]
MIQRRQKGMTLIELVIVIAVVAILGGIAYPSYIAYMQRGNRAAAKAVLDQAAQYMERQFTTTNVYPDSVQFAAAGYNVAPLGSSGPTKKYDVTLTAATPTAFTLRATPTSGSVDPKCGWLALDNLGNRASELGVARECWDR